MWSFVSSGSSTLALGLARSNENVRLRRRIQSLLRLAPSLEWRPLTSRRVPEGVDRHTVVVDREIESVSRARQSDLPNQLRFDLGKHLSARRVEAKHFDRVCELVLE